MTEPNSRFSRYQELQRYVAWTGADADRVRVLGPVVDPALPELIDDFYAEIQRHPDAQKVITGGAEQVERLKRTLIAWLRELFSGEYNASYVDRRWRVGNRHVEIGLNQVYTNVALARLRSGLVGVAQDKWRGTSDELSLCIASLHKLLDLDLAIIEDAYQAEYLRRQQQLERRQMQATVQDREARLRAIHNTATDAIVTFDIEGTIESANPAAIRTFDCKELVGQDIHRFVPGIMLASEQLRNEMRGIREGGGEFPLEVLVSELSLDGQRLYTAFMRDISELKYAQAQLLQSERLAAIGKAMAGLVHESRNALQRSQAGLERLARRVAKSPDAQELIQNIQRAQDDLHHLYEEVREYAAPVRLQPKVANIDECMTEAWIHLTSGSADVSTELKVMPAAFDLSCQFDPFTMRQVFRNILENAIAANQNSGEIEVNFAEQNFNGRPAISISIRDHGPGLSKVQQSRMFEEFYTTKTRGTGLGLPIARRIVEAHGGKIVAISAPGAGADIRITLPRSLS